MFELEPPGSPDPSDWPSVAGARNHVGHLAVAVPGAVAGLWARISEPGACRGHGCSTRRSRSPETASRSHGSCFSRSPPATRRSAPTRRWRRSCSPTAGFRRARTADSPGERLDQRELADDARVDRAATAPTRSTKARSPRRSRPRSQQGDGILTAEDLAGYEPKILTEPPAHYRDLEYVTACDTVGYETLGILDRFDLAGSATARAEHYHLLAEAMGHAFADGATYSSDPDFTEDPVEELGSPEFAATRAAAISLDRAAPRPIVPAAPWPGGPRRPASAGGVSGTTQVVCGDAEGNLVSLITTIGADFGSLVAVPGTGVILNNSMINYDPRPDRGNSIAPGKMPFFAVPTLVATRDGRPALAAAGSGGYPILAGVINTIVNHVDHGLSIQAAIDRPAGPLPGERRRSSTHACRNPSAPASREIGHELVVQAMTPGELPFSRVSAVAVTDGIHHRRLRDRAGTRPRGLCEQSGGFVSSRPEPLRIIDPAWIPLSDGAACAPASGCPSRLTSADPSRRSSNTCPTARTT